MKVALVYDRVNKWGGAERVLLKLHELFPEAPLYTSVYNAKTAPWAEVFPHIHTSFLQKLPLSRTNHDKLAALMPMAFESFSFNNFDLVISVTSEAAKGIITHSKTKHICYCLTPTRYLWSGHDVYFRNKVLKHMSKPLIQYLRHWDKIAANRPDTIVSISQEVKKRVKLYYGRNSLVIHPPSDSFFSEGNIVNKKNYYVLIGRLVPYKRVDLAVEAFNELGLPLYIVGTGSEEKYLKKFAKQNVHFLGNVTDRRIKRLYSEAKALIFPQEEDFGLVAVEAQSAGTPVIAFAKGGAIDIIQHRQTGVLFRHQEPKELIQAVKMFDTLSFNRLNIIKNSERFSTEIFYKKFDRLIRNAKRRI